MNRISRIQRKNGNVEKENKWKDFYHRHGSSLPTNGFEMFLNVTKTPKIDLEERTHINSLQEITNIENYEITYSFLRVIKSKHE